MVPAISRALGLRLAALLGGFALLTAVAPARAADADKLDTSLKIIPDDAAFYSSSLRLKEQVDAVAKSRAWAKLWALPSVQMGWTMLEAQYKGPGQFAPVRAFFEQEENKELLALLGDAGSHEVFLYGGESWAGFFELFQKVYGAVQYEPLKAQLTGNAGGRDQPTLQAAAALQMLAKNLDQIKIPDLVLGAKLTDTKKAEKQLKRLEALLEMAAAQVPELKGRVKRAKVNDGSFLTLTFDGSMVPWDMIPWKNVEEKPGEFGPLVAKLKTLTLTISIGIQHDYLMLSIGGTTEQLARVGGAGPRLSARPELKPLAKFADRKLVSIGYVSKSFLSRVARGQDYESMFELAKVALPQANLPEAQQAKILKDLDAFAKTLKDANPDIGAIFGFSFLTDRGMESYTYSYTKNANIDGSKPLTLLSHVGGDPILAAVSRTKSSGDGYADLVKGIKVIYGHVDEIVLAKLAGDEKDQYVKVTEKLLPLFKRLDENTGKQFLPSLADGQVGFVIDAKWSSKQWLKNIPATEKAMPLPEIGIILGVSDAAKLRKAMAEYLEIANDMIGAMRSLAAAAGAIGDFKLPPPESVKRPSGTLYFYPIPEESGLDRRVIPTAGLSEKVAALTLSHAHAERLLKATPLKIDAGPLADPLKPLAGAFYFNWPVLVDTATPWIEYGADSIMDGQGVPKEGRKGIMDQVRVVLEVLKVFRGSTSATYVEDGAIVTHSETVIKDLEK